MNILEISGTVTQQVYLRNCINTRVNNIDSCELKNGLLSGQRTTKTFTLNNKTFQ